MDYIEILISIAIVIIILVFTIILTVLAPAPVVFMEPYIDVSNINNKFDDINKQLDKKEELIRSLQNKISEIESKQNG